MWDRLLEGKGNGKKYILFSSLLVHEQAEENKVNKAFFTNECDVQLLTIVNKYVDLKQNTNISFPVALA